MNEVERQLIRFLADPDLSDRHFREAVQWLTSARLDRTISAAAELRKHMQYLFNSPPSHASSVDDEVFVRLKKMLLVDSKMDPRKALRKLAAVLGLKVQFPAKVTFRTGLEQLGGLVDASTLLSAGERLYGDGVKTPNAHAWPLNQVSSLELE